MKTIYIITREVYTNINRPQLIYCHNESAFLNQSDCLKEYDKCIEEEKEDGFVIMGEDDDARTFLQNEDKDMIVIMILA